MRLLMQPSSGTSHSSFGSELGLWALPDLRLGAGYNFALSGEPGNVPGIATKRGFYFTITSKLSNLFNLFGTAHNDFVGSAESSTDTGGKP
jgi:hypothetical protein